MCICAHMCIDVYVYKEVTRGSQISLRDYHLSWLWSTDKIWKYGDKGYLTIWHGGESIRRYEQSPVGWQIGACWEDNDELSWLKDRRLMRKNSVK